MVPALAVAERATVPAPHRDAGVVPVIVGKVLVTVAAIAVLLAEVQVPLAALT